MHLKYLILFAFPLQQWLHEHVSVLHYVYVAYLVSFNFFVDFVLTCIVTSVSHAFVHCTGVMGKIFCLCACRCGRSPWLRARGKLQYGIHGDGWWVSFPSSLPLLGTELTQPTGGLRWCGTLQALPSARGTTTC